MSALRWAPEALEDLKRLHAFIEPHSPEAATRAIDTLIAATESLLDFLQKGRPWPPDPAYRELSVLFGARGYVIRYRIYQGDIIVVRVWHALEAR